MSTPKAVRVRTASGWQDIAIVGPPGPQGPQGPAGPTSPDPELFKPSIKYGSATAGESGGFTSSWEVYGDSLGDMRHQIIPARNVWWEVQYFTIARTIDAAWRRIDGRVQLDVGVQTTDALGFGSSPYAIYYTHVEPSWVSVQPKALFKLEAGKNYTARGVLIVSGVGTWVTYFNRNFVWSISKVVGFW